MANFSKFFVILFTLSGICVNFPVNGAAKYQDSVTVSNGDITLAGTLSTPEDKKASTVMILISGSGPQNRDSELMGFKPFKILSDSLTKEGFAVLRYDDRGVGASSGKRVMESTSEELATDVLAWVNYLKERNEFDYIGLIGHSEGGVIAPKVAVASEAVDFIVLMAGYGFPGSTITAMQQKAILESSGFSDAYIKKAQQLNELVLGNAENFSEEELRDTATAKLKEMIPLMPEQQRNSIADEEQFIGFQVMQMMMQLKSPWLKYYFSYDPIPTLKKVKCPVLMLFGSLDTQVPAEANQQIMTEALQAAGNDNYKAITLEKANHLFQKADTGAPSEYASLPKAFHPELIQAMVSWLKDHE